LLKLTSNALVTLVLTEQGWLLW